MGEELHLTMHRLHLDSNTLRNTQSGEEKLTDLRIISLISE